MIQKKICMLGAYAVGKTSLVRRFVHSVFSEKYLTTVGVKIDKKDVQVGDVGVTLVLWDLAGEDRFAKISDTHLRGSSSYLLVVDGTRRNTLDHARELQKKAESKLGPVPFVLVLNKCDLRTEWELSDDEVQSLNTDNCIVKETSAKTGAGVEAVFDNLARRVLES